MKAAVLEKDGIHCKEITEPITGPGMVKVKVSYCGICGSDIPRVLEGKAHHYPLILGHEFSGIVSEIGEGVTSLNIGEKVAVVPLSPCFKCNVCRKGLYSLCQNYKFIGSRVDGGYAEYVCVPERNLIKIPEEMGLKEASMIEPCSVARHALSLVDVTDKSVAVIGSGIIGLFMAQWLKIKGASRTILITHGFKSLNEKELGIDLIMADTSATDLKAEVIIDCAGVQQTINLSLDLAEERAEIVLIGTPKKELHFSVKQWELINRKELTIKGSWMSYSGDFPGLEWIESISALNSRTIKIDDSLISTISLEAVPDYFNDIKKERMKARVIISFTEESKKDGFDGRVLK